MAQALFLAPYWHNSEHVGRRRVASMKRWLEGAGHKVRVVAAGPDGSAAHGLDVADPLRGGGDVRTGVRSGAFAKLRRFTHELRHMPDDGIAWARRVADNSRVRELASQSDLIFSSSPPESTHFAAHVLSREFDLPHLCDLQDGWIDEPLRPILQQFALRRRIEGRHERRILGDSALVMVTSEVWRRRLIHRYPDLAPRIHSLALGLGSTAVVTAVENARLASPPVLLHAGSFTLSHNTRRMELLLEPMLQASAGALDGFVIELLGKLHAVEESAVAQWNTRFAAKGGSLQHRSALPREEFLQLLPRYSGALLLSVSMGAVPSKLYEYLALGRPVLAVCPEGSAVDELAQSLPALFAVNTLDATSWTEAMDAFLNACRDGQTFAPPAGFADDVLAKIFLQRVGPLLESH